MKKIVLSLGLLTLITAQPVWAGEKEILTTLQKLEVPSKDVKIYSTSFPGMSVAMTSRGTFYVSQDGRFISQGPIYDMKSGTPQTIIRDVVKSLVDGVKKNAITYKAENEKAQITVFTDITCTYCQKFHQNLAEYNKLGITVNYLAFPREGLQSDTGKQMEAIWSASDKKAALEKGFKGETLPISSSPASFIAPHVNVGHQIGVSGTPTIVLSNGEVIGGFVPPEKLKEIINRIH